MALVQSLRKRYTKKSLNELLVLSYVHSNPNESADTIAEKFQTSGKSMQNYLGKLRRKGLVIASIAREDSKYRYSSDPAREDYFRQIDNALGQLRDLEIREET